VKWEYITMSAPVRWGILSTGSIAKTFACGLAQSQSGTLVAVGSRDQSSADAFGAEFGISRCYGSYDDLLADPEVDAVYIATPHPLHAQWALRAAEAGKHILCEKPLTLNHADAMAVVEAARRQDVFLMEAFMYRSHPQIARLRDLVQHGAIGQVRLIQATFSFDAGYNLNSRLLSNALGGGGILDVGCYCVSMARLVAGAALGKAFAEPLEVSGTAHVGTESRVDEYALATMQFPGGILAQLATGVRLNQENVVRIFGSAGSITLPEPWVPRDDARIIVQRGNEREEIVIPKPGDPYALEADTVAAHIAARQSPTMSWDDTLGNLQSLDRWRAAVGVIYDEERPEAQRGPLHGRPLAVRAGSLMRYGAIDGLEKRVSRLVLGVDNQVTMPHASAMFDDFFEQGGNCFDTAYIYASGHCERLLGHWITARGVREQIVVIGKGAHTPYCTPEHMRWQLAESLERLQTDYVDIYMLHRDNPDIAAGEFIEALNEEQGAGRMRIFGASNWSLDRIADANAYAAERGLNGFSVISNNFSLARMVAPPWDGCLAVSDVASRSWLRERQIPLLPWSSQARGFFTERAHPDNHSDEELVRCWYSDDNFERKRRAEELASKRGVLPLNIALAYVLHQPFPTFPLIGPRTLAETSSSLRALTVELSPEEVAWLNLEA
jgi:predicted dehydrogenase/aryl-alcohol dehydrogenase-like predicted oxidoreductase